MKRWSRILFPLFFVLAGGVHFAIPDFYAERLPPWVPNAKLIVLLAGAGEVIAGAAAFFSRARRLAATAIMLFLIGVVLTNVAFLLRTHPTDLVAWFRVVMLAALCCWAALEATAAASARQSIPAAETSNRVGG